MLHMDKVELRCEEVFSSAWEVGTEEVDRIVGLKDSLAGGDAEDEQRLC